MIIFVSDFFIEDYVGGAELTTQSLIDSCLLPYKKIKSHQVNVSIMNKYADCFWIFANFTNLNKQCILHALKNLKYSVLEYDYKYCDMRSPGKHIVSSGACNCEQGNHAKLISLFYNSAVTTWWMSENQKNIYKNLFPFLKDENNKVLSSVFSDDHLEYILSLSNNKKNDNYIILNSQSWIKGKEDAIQYALKNKLKFELVWGLEYEQLLDKLSRSRGLIFFPRAGDTCPRLVIEAKLLNCELILNDNVQHKDEPWFQTASSCVKYLKERTKIFWNTLESLWHLNTPSGFNTSEDIKFNIIVPFYNVSEWISKCLASVQSQNYNNYHCYVIDDISSDDSYNIAKESIKGDPRFTLIKNVNKKYALGNIASTLENTDLDPSAVVIVLDGDDWLASRNVLSHLNNVYSQEQCLMTYGSYVYHPTGQRGVEPSQYPEEVIENNLFREDKWRGSHLRSFKLSLWRNINHEDLKDTRGYYKMAYDQAIMLPLLEMASERSRYVPETLYVYNRSNPNNVDKIKQRVQFETAKKIRGQQKYTRIA